MYILRGYPLVYYITVLIKDLDSCALKLFAACDVSLADLHLCLCVFNKEDCVAFLICRPLYSVLRKRLSYFF